MWDYKSIISFDFTSRGNNLHRCGFIDRIEIMRIYKKKETHFTIDGCY